MSALCASSLIDAPDAKRMWLFVRSVRPVVSMRTWPEISRIWPTEPSMAACSAARSLVLPSAFTPNDEAAMVPAVLSAAADVELAGAAGLAGAAALAGAAEEAELAGVAVEAPPLLFLLLQRSATESAAP